jgi:hypothetical protein
MRRAGKAVLFIHHSGKRGSQRGSSKKEDTLDVVINLRPPKNYSPEQGARFELHFEKYRHGAGETLQPLEATLLHDETGGTTWQVTDVKEGLVDIALSLIDQGLSMTEVADRLDVDKSTISRWAKRAATRSRGPRKSIQ